MRGGITIGKLYHSNEEVFGPALNEAYELESKVAQYLRIILGDTIIKYTIENNSWNVDDEIYEEYFRENLISKDTDDMYYLDYFMKAKPSFLFLDYTYEEYISNLQNVITIGLSNSSLVT